MSNDGKWLQWAVELQSLAQAGLTYGRDAYDRERYERIREISAEMMVSAMSDIPTETVRGLFCNETGYQTPKLDTRAAVFRTERYFSSAKTTGNGRCREAGAT